MKFRCERDVLLDALATAGRAVTGRGGALPVLAGVRLDIADGRLRIVGSDLDLTIRTEVDVATGESGSTVLPSRLINDIIRSLDTGAVDIEIDSEEARVSAGRSQFTVRTLPVDDFPNLGEPSGEEVTVSADELSAGLRQVVLAASVDDARPILTGVLMTAEEGGLRLVATDSYRLAMRDLPGTSILSRDQTVLVPSRALEVVGRLLGDVDDLTICLGEREAVFTVGDVQVVTSLIVGEYPNYRALIPDDHPNSLVVERDDMLDALRRVRLLATDNTPVRLEMSGDGLELIAITQDIGQAHETVDATYDGEDLTVAFNPAYLIAGLEVCPDEELRLETCDALKPAVIRGVEDSDFLYLLMPVRVS